MDLNLQDKVVLVTGGSKGIGAGIVRSFLAEGARVANVNRSTEEGIALEAEYAAQGKDCFFIQGDLSEVDACRNAIEATIKKFGRIDILVNNAGVNDSVYQARSLGRMLKRAFGSGAHVNVIPWNNVDGINHTRPSGNVIHKFCGALAAEGVNQSIRKTRGLESNAACGQLAGQRA